ncbi:MAG: class I SAM-dependent methyltransferase [Phycisphaerales bacterium]|nr:class I SAM-dependent methyltransferase [Phycisphaerales bacterium]
MAHSQPFFAEVQAHYDLSNDFFALFLDPSMTYSCAYFARPGMNLEQAQLAKLDLALNKCDLHPGMRLLDVGCGWGSCARRAADRFDIEVIGLTLSRNQLASARSQQCAGTGRLPGRIDFRLQGWEEFEEPVDRIISIGAFEHFRRERHAAFFERCRDILPGDGRMLLHCIVEVERGHWREPRRHTREDTAFARFIRREIFPGAQLCTAAAVIGGAQRAGFRVTRVQSLQMHYARTLDFWSANLRAAREHAIGVTSERTYNTYDRYLSGCGRYFRIGRMDVVQFTCECA